LKNKQLEPMTLAGEEVGTKISKNKRFEPTALTGEEVGTKTLRQEGEEQSSLTQGASHALYESHPYAQEGLEDGSRFATLNFWACD
jgi:hypothetical protein